MHSTKNARRLLQRIVALVLLIGGTVVQAQAQGKKDDKKDDPSNTFIAVGESKQIQMRSKKEIKAVFNPKQDLLQTDIYPKNIVIRGLQEGTVRLELTDVDGATEIHVVHIVADVVQLREVLKKAVPTANVDVISFRGGVILTGNVARAEDVDTILRVAGAITGSGGQGVVNAMSVGGVHQVQLDVTVARVDRTKTRQKEFAIIVGGTTVSAGSILGGLTSPSATAGNNTVAAGVGIIPGAMSALPNASPNLILGIVPAQIQALLQALKTEGLAKLVAEPKLVTQSGRPARFLSGGRQATLSAASGINGPGVTYEDVGTELEFLPIVYGNGKIYLEVAPRVRGVNQGLGTATSFGTVVGFDEQSIRTSIVLESGQTFAIGGLIQTNLQSSVKKVPWLGDLPFIGSAFSAIQQTEQEQELVILVTPHLVDPMDCNQVPDRLPGRETRAADDFELYLESMMELPRGQRNVFEGRRYKAAWKNDPTAGAFPCAPASNGGYGHGFGNGGNCSTIGGCAPSMKTGSTAINTKAPPANLPTAVNLPIDLPSPPRDR